MQHLEETFSTLREYKMKLNPPKCTFGVSSDKFLGYIVTQRGIEASTKQIKAMLQLESPKKPKDVQRLAGKVAALSRFISRSSDKCRLFYDILRKSQKFEWTADHEQAFKELKHYLSTPPLLSKPEQGEPLYLYLAVTEVAVSEVLVREQDKEQKPVYYALADFVSDFSPAIQNLADEEILTLEGNKEAEIWQMNIDGASNQMGAGMQLALELGVRNLQIFSDSLLIVDHVNDEYIASDSKMIAYLKVAKDLKQKFRDYKLKQIPRDQNVETDALATLGATFKPAELANIPIAHMLEPSIQKLEEADKRELENQQDRATVLPTTDGHAAVQPNDQLADQTDDWDWADAISRLFQAWFGIRSEIKCDNRSQFNSNDAEAYCTRWNISQKKSAPKTPKSNGKAESGNKIIMDNLRRRLHELGGKWADELPLVRWSDVTTPKTATGQTPFSLVFGAEPVIPSEVLVQTHRLL
ncbi:uncharacterized protein LOC141617106 [Silene latifolia]|uniref:uncharacterized protein LOC141617106 n=1 Tax=Silene latifolia TaxID=37657 RepID=UPI003D777E1A